MDDLGFNKKWSELLSKCNQSLKDRPEWMTPYLFLFRRESSTRNIEKAKEYLSDFESKRGEIYKEPYCAKFESFLKSELGAR
jgi:hypothetical protein